MNAHSGPYFWRALKAPFPGEDATGGGLRSSMAATSTSGRRPEFAILSGSLAPKGCAIRLNAFEAERRDGAARVFTTTETALEAIDGGHLRAGHVVVLHGTVDTAAVITALNANGLSHLIVVTDGAYEGPCYGPVITDVTPGAAAGGPIGRVANDDIIRLDIAARQIEVLNPVSARPEPHTPGRGFGPSEKYAAALSQSEDEA